MRFRRVCRLPEGVESAERFHGLRQTSFWLTPALVLLLHRPYASVAASRVETTVFEASSSVTTATGFQELIDRIVAVVDLDVITLSEAEQARRVRLIRGGEAWSLLQAVERLIERVLIEREVQKNPMSATGESNASASALVDDLVERIRSEFVSPSAYDDALSEQDMSESELRRELRQQLRVNDYLNRRFRALVYVTQDEIESFYKDELTKELAPAKPPPIEEVSDQIESIVMERKFNARVERWIEELKERAEIRRYVW